MAEVRQALAHAAATLNDRLEAELLLVHVLGKPRSWLIAHANDELDAAHAAAFEALVQRRSDGEPVAYLTGRRGFWSLDLEVTPATLIPRPETELLVELALDRLPATGAARVADLGTGSGAIALAIARESPAVRVVATDASADALAVAQRNAIAQRIGNVAFAHGDWLAPLHGQVFDVIVSNPPYIESGDPHLGQGDLRFEPMSALASGADGLDDIRRIVTDARAHLKPGGWLLMEHGWNQGEAVRALLQASGYREVFTAQDLEQRDRVSGGRQA
ncbi:peptide chain release factor N(5)-glutamine methyltransferase [Dyella jiangningensis]|uniref:Release factor glutamine methyltransferase n=1 Tax=Dyella jiangningensis TaxID=1379159 RepID=A0A328P724_9GAMM|nr:peptide chain release factor N(5)-glutamine methyltransferase [Dyella jiangningensis]RAO77113.1 protein-(glutamine-N5) methyltransferase, release factor-specific [Dyella jiangningensis]